MLGGTLYLQRFIERVIGRRGALYVPRTARLTSTSWDGDSFSTAAKTLINLNTVFGVPRSVRAVDVAVSIRDSASAAATTTCWLVLSPVITAAVGRYVYCAGLANDAWHHEGFIVPCDQDGNIYYQIDASGVSTIDIYIEIWGWWI